MQTIAYAAKQTPEGQTRHSKRIDSSVFVTGVFLFGKKKKKKRQCSDSARSGDFAVAVLHVVFSYLFLYLLKFLFAFCLRTRLKEINGKIADKREKKRKFRNRSSLFFSFLSF